MNKRKNMKVSVLICCIHVHAVELTVFSLDVFSMSKCTYFYVRIMAQPYRQG